MPDLITPDSPDPAAGTAAGIPKIHRVLVAMNFTELCTSALRHAHSLLPGGGAIRLVHVCHEPTRGVNPIIAAKVYFEHCLETARAKEEAEEKLKALPPALLSVPGVAISSEVVTHSSIAGGLCEEAGRFDADVICMGTKGHSRAGAALLGSTVQAVLAQARVPVFVVPPSRGEPHGPASAAETTA